ncbi:flagellin [Clostridium sp. CX1]|uniref:flagellin N-terminal helical domain-containing protein n=1 Tax=Clostridium sp. CX1 TaxID=2978346 RepID=UPI0021BE655F|nr:flagellin [Clostridium sp. CX1]MCT8976115.1 flagellin [Clostridium sp. CX1]
MRLSHNIASLNVYRTYSKVLDKQSDALGKISSGYKVNTAKDDPNVIAQSERMRMQIRGLQMAGRNAQDGVSMLQTAEGGLDSITSMLQRIRELVVQSGSGINNSEDKQTIQNEIIQMVDGIKDIANNTELNGVKMLNPEKDKDGNVVQLTMAIGANADESVKIPRISLMPESLSTIDKNTSEELTLEKLKNDYSITKDNSIDRALTIVDAALNTVTTIRSKYGALENRFEDSLGNIGEISDRLEGADSNIRDADIAQEMIALTKNNLLAEAGNAMMVQTNKFPQDVLRILENVRSR